MNPEVLFKNSVRPALHPVFAALNLALLATAHLPAAETIQPPVTPTSPFLSLTHDEALSRAKAENKPLLLFFDGHWSERAREVRPKIFSATAIAAINDHALALRIDVLAAPELTKQYRIFRVPTLLWINPTGSVRHEWVDCEDPSDIRDEIVETLTRLPKLRASTRPDDPLGRFKLAHAFFDAGDYAAALTETRWLYLEALGDASSTKEKNKKHRVSVWDVIKFLEEPAPFYEPARATAREFMEREEPKVRANPAHGTAAGKFWRLARILGETERIVALHDSLPPGSARDTLGKHIPKSSKP